MRRFALFALPALAGCQIPERLNPYDPAIAPQVKVRLLVAGLDAAVVNRIDAPVVEVTITDPQRDPADVTVSVVDGRVPSEIAQGDCPPFPPFVFGSADDAVVVSFPLELGSPVCFDPGEPGQRFRVEATARHHETRGDSELSFLLVNSPPQADAGPAIFRDANWDGPVRLTGARSADADGDALSYAWSVPGDVAIASGSASDASLEILPNPSRKRDRIALEVCDPWGSCSTAAVDVFQRRAIWMLAADGLALLDPGWSEVQSFFVSSSASLGVYCGGFGAPAPDGGLWIFHTGSIPQEFRRTTVDGQLAATVPLPTGYMNSVLAQSPSEGIAWVSGYYNFPEVYRVGPGDALVSEPLSLADGEYPRAGARDPNRDVTWIASDATAGPIVWRIDDTAGVTEIEPEVAACLDADSIERDVLAMSIDENDGTVFVLGSDDPADPLDDPGDARIAVIAPDGSTVGCLAVAFAAKPNSMAWTPGGVAVGFEESALVFVDPVSGVTEDGPQFPIGKRGGLFLSGDALFAAGSAGFAAIDPLTLDITAALGVSLTGDLSFATVSVGMDSEGRPWSVAAPSGSCMTLDSHVLRFPRDLELVRAHVSGVGVPAVGAATIDPRDGRLWIAEVEAGSWAAVAYDERGRIDIEGGEVALSTSEQPYELFFDVGAGVRTPAFWVATHSGVGMSRILRVAVDGFVEVDVVVVGEALSPALDPVNGSFWASGGPAGEQVRRVTPTGAVSTKSEPAVFLNRFNVDEPRGTVDAQGRYWAPQSGDGFVRVDQDLASSLVSSQPVCNDQLGLRIEGTSGLFFDRDVTEIGAECRFTYLEGVQPGDQQPVAGTARLTLDGSTVRQVLIEPAPGSGALLHPDGTMWVSDAQLRMRVFDRNGNTTLGRPLTFFPIAPVTQ